MYTALIVEDEIFALHSIRATLNWQAAGIDRVLEADNGRKALELYHQEHPDIIMTDLKMPVMDGLTLIRTIREEGDRRTRFIIMSCLDEFSLVQQALNMGVSHYFLKATTSCAEMQEILQQITRELDGAACSDTGAAQQLLQSLCDGRALKPEEAEKVFSALELPSFGYLLLLLQPLGNGPPPEVGELRRRLSGDETDGVPLYRGQGPVLLSLSRGRYAALLPRERADALTGTLPGICAGMGLQAGVSSVLSGAERLSDAMTQALAALDSCWFTGESWSCWSGEEEYHLPGRIAQRLMALPGTLLHLPGSFTDSYSRRMGQLVSRGYRDAASFREALCAMTMWLPMQTGCVSDSAEEDCMACVRRIQQSPSLSQSVSCFESFTSEILSLSTFSSQMPAGVAAALLYIRDNLDHPLTLNEIAVHTHLNPSYLSTLFHKVMRQSLISYVNAVRIERARSLLRSTDLPVSQIASSLGFSQDIYFYRLFKRLTHETPSEYRASCRQEPVSGGEGGTP